MLSSIALGVAYGIVGGIIGYYLGRLSWRWWGDAFDRWDALRGKARKAAHIDDEPEPPHHRHAPAPLGEALEESPADRAIRLAREADPLVHTAAEERLQWDNELERARSRRLGLQFGSIPPDQPGPRVTGIRLPANPSLHGS